MNVDPRRSLMVTDQNVLSSLDENDQPRFSLRRVLAQMASQNRNRTVTATGLFRQLWDTQNPAPGIGPGPHCDDNGTTINGFPNSCRQEGIQATQTPDAFLDGYFPTALINRFDLAPVDGSHCGEYRIIYSKGQRQGSGRNFIIFEAVLPNPHRGCGLAACRPIQQTWASLSRISDPNQRAALLDRFFFDGQNGFAPVIHFRHFAPAGGTYGNAESGQIRTNQFMQGPWTLKEFKLTQSCRSTPVAARPGVAARGLAPQNNNCTLQFTPVTVKGSPFGPLFDPTNRAGTSFRADFLSQVGALAASDLNRIGFGMDDVYNAAETPSGNLTNYRNQFNTGPQPSRWSDQIQSVLNDLDSNLTPTDIVARAETQNCMGCHQNMNNRPIGGGLTWPGSLGFVHVSEFSENGPDGARFPVSPALENVFLPERERIMERFLSGVISATPVAVRGSGPTPTLLGRPAVH